MSNTFEIAIDDQVDRKAAERAERLMPGGVPRYVRIWDKEDEHDRYTVLFTKKANQGHDGRYFMYVSLTVSGAYYHGELRSDHQGKHLGKRITFDQLPECCKTIVITDYEDLWDL